MLDILGREVQRGDIIAYTTTKKSENASYTSTQLGIVNNILPDRVYKRGSWQHTRIETRHNKNTSLNNNYSINSLFSDDDDDTVTVAPVQILNKIPDEIQIAAKITFYTFNISGLTAKLIKNSSTTKQYQVLCTNSFLLVDKTTIPQQWMNSYNKVKELLKI